MSFRFIEDHRDAFPVRLMCAVLEVSPAGYYAWRDRPVSERTKSNATRLAAIQQVHQASSGPLRQSPRPRRPAQAGPWRQPRPDRADDASARHPRHHGTAVPCAHHRQPSRPAGTLGGRPHPRSWQLGDRHVGRTHHGLHNAIAPSPVSGAWRKLRARRTELRLRDTGRKPCVTRSRAPSSLCPKNYVAR
ncbi:hypothetical protein ACVJGD_000365 [Bradyrhizobium sp. USDA 10063]